jgi:hypothetical protein
VPPGVRSDRCACGGHTSSPALAVASGALLSCIEGGVGASLCLPRTRQRPGSIRPAGGRLPLVPCGRSQRGGGDDRYTIVDAPTMRALGRRTHRRRGWRRDRKDRGTADTGAGRRRRKALGRTGRPETDERGGQTREAVLVRTGRRAEQRCDAGAARAPPDIRTMLGQRFVADFLTSPGARPRPAGEQQSHRGSTRFQPVSGQPLGASAFPT